ncbi:hypothetical protein VTO42DRAFT_16 [Malbranchea cinnamomea]
MTAFTNDQDLTRRTVRKLDFILLPFLSVLFLVNSLDRSNIGNAETAGFTHDAELDPKDLNDAVAMFFVFFVALQPVGAAAGRKFGMSVWVPSVMTIWGICTLLHVWVRNRTQLITLRIIIGMLEAGFYPTTVSYLSLFYTRYEFGRRLGLFYGSYGVAGAVGGVIAYVVFSWFQSDGPHDGNQLTIDGSWKPWQILFLVEGCLTIVIAVIGFFWLPKSAGSAWFLTAEEAAWAEERIRLDRETPNVYNGSDTSAVHRNSPAEINYEPDNDDQTRGLLSEVQTITDSQEHALKESDITADSGLSRPQLLSTVLFLPLIVPILILNIATAIPATGFSIFLPLVLSSLKLSSPLHSNILTAPPFLLASITLYIFTHWSDKSRRRIIPILASLGIIILGLSLTLLLSSSSSFSSLQAVALYLSLCILLSGSYIPSPLTVAWFAGNIPDPGKRAIVLGINGYGNLAGVLSAYIFSPRWQEEGYRVSFWITLAITLTSALGFAALKFVLIAINDARAKLLSRWSVAEVDRERVLGLGKASGWSDAREVPAFATVGGTWWDRQVRYWIGRRTLKMHLRDTLVRRGDERFTFQYGL